MKKAIKSVKLYFKDFFSTKNGYVILPSNIL
jgi:hypothetical protein